MNKQDKSKISKNFKTNLDQNNKIKQEINYFIADLDMEADRAASAETTQTIHNEYSDVSTGIFCFKGIFSLQVKDDVKPYQVPSR